MGVLEMDELTRFYGNVLGVNDISLDLEPGAYGLLGPNGSGKSTLIHLIMGQLRPSRGTVRVFGSDPLAEPAVLKRIGLSPEGPLTISGVSGFDFVVYLIEQYGFSRKEAEERAERALERVAMEDYMHDAISTYSRGMRQRIKLAQSFAHRPDLLLLDEPFTGLDPVGRHSMMTFLQNWIDEGRSLIFASHVLEEVEGVTDEFLLICKGRLLASGHPSEIRRLLTDVPVEVTLKAVDPRGLGRELADADHITEMRFPGDGTLTVSTNSPLQLYQTLPELIEQKGVDIRELSGAEDSLESLFEHLLERNR